MPKGLKRLALGAIVVLVSAMASLAAHASPVAQHPAASKRLVLVGEAATTDPAELGRRANRRLLSAGIGVLAGAVVGTAVVTSTPLMAGTAVLYAVGTAVVAGTAVVGGYLGVFLSDY